MFLQRLFKRFGVKRGLTLDIGCGGGFFTNLLSGMGCEVWGVDFDSKQIIEARKTYPRDFLIADSRCPPFPASTFDLIFCRALSTLYTDMRLRGANEQRLTLLELLRAGGLFVYQTASDLSRKRTTIWNHEVDDVLSFFRLQGFQVTVYFFFAITFIFRLLGTFAFSSSITQLSRTLTKITGRPGYIVCAVKKEP